MANIVYWNIENFGINKVNNPNNRRPSGQGGNTNAQASADRRALIGNILLGNANPDIIVIVEVSSSFQASDLATNTGGMLGAQFVLNRLRANPGDPNAADWRMVPPLQIGAIGLVETVAVLYRGVSGVGAGAVHRYFTGPNIWTGALAGSSQVPGGGVGAIAYPVGGGGVPNIDAFLVPPGTVARNIPAGAQHNGGGVVAENTVAARIRFLVYNPGAAPGPLLVNYALFRQPYMVTFVETNAAGVVQRDLTLFAVHAPPNPVYAANFMALLATTDDIASALVGAEVKCLCGDFNLNALNVAGANSGVYAPVTALGYVPLLNPPLAPPAPVNLQAYQGYFATHILPTPSKVARTANSQFLWSDNTVFPALPSPYPGYGYIGSALVANFYSIDNILLNPAPGGHNFTVLNPVVGSPYNLVGVVPPPGAPPGVIVLGQQFANVGVPPWPINPAPNYTLGVANNLCSWDNYKRLRSTSDHLPLYAFV